MELRPTRIEANGPPLLIAGLSESYSSGAPIDAVSQWERFAPHLGAMSAQKGSTTYGLCFDMDSEDGFKYLCGVEVSDTEGLPNGFIYKQLPSHTYAVFSHEGHVSTLRQTLDAIAAWLPQSDLEKPEGVDFFFERYDERFDPHTGTGVVEIWVPIEASHETAARQTSLH